MLIYICYYYCTIVLLCYCIDTHTPSELLRTHFADLTDAITPTLTSVTNVMYSKRLISFETYNDIITTKGDSDFVKSSKLVGVLQRQLKAHGDPQRYLVNICHVLRNQQHQRLREITTFILQQLGELINVLLYLTMYLISLR